MKRVAIPVTNGKLSEYFGQCSHYEIFEIDEEQIISNAIEIPSEKEISMLLPWISSRGITDVICYKVDKRIINLFSAHKVNLYVGIRMDVSQEIIENYLNGTLKSDKNIISEIMTQKK
ncbi:MAG: hypothetical protein K9H64_12610 [Bacteroidales bacterium]|nr:hypothetical protein [Bacteroidales bacterium]MCF8456911.1 hypothetical protein [Bacteroidales bacterium]